MKMKNLLLILVFSSAAWSSVSAQSPTSSPPLTPQQQAARDATREKLRALLDSTGPKVDLAFRQSDQQPYNFVGVLATGFKNAESFEVVISVSREETIHFRVFPHFSGAYINLDKVKNSDALMRQMARFVDKNFMFWGADGSGDIFAGYNLTLESGFPDESIRIVLRSIANLDKYVGEMRPAIDGSTAP